MGWVDGHWCDDGGCGGGKDERRTGIPAAD